MAHELYFDFRGQSSFDQRVVPQYQMAVGGLYTVRGYPEAAVAGDDALIGTAEYRFHVPRAFAFEPEPHKFLGKDFRAAPQQVYGPVDWDLILRPFLDAAAVHADAGAGLPSQDYTLLGAGVGVELQYRRNITVRLDWGDPLRSIPGVVNAGASRLHFVLTLLY
jgi:hemolysin activation/secretion protein